MREPAFTGLEADDILIVTGKEKLRPETLKKILRNEKYIGDALQHKTYTVDFLSKKRINNNGIVPQYYVENSHEPIIPRELFMQIQEEMVRRANLRGGKGGKNEFTAVSILYRVLFTADSAVIFTDGYIGITEDISRLSGDASAVWRRRTLNALLLP